MPAHHHLPSKRERLQVLMRLKSQRQLLMVGVASLAVLCAGLTAFVVNDQTQDEVIALGEGQASVETMPVDEIPTVAEAAGQPITGGEASFYGNELAGNPTASGEAFDPQALTAAHRTLPLGSRVRVTNPRNGETVTVRINDRGPFHGNRVIDLSYAAAREIGLIAAGTGRVNLALIT